jgi:hypothetical protein
MPFVKTGIATVGIVKCSCGMTLESVFTKCPKCGKNLRPASRSGDDKPSPPKDNPEDSHSC